MFVCLIIIKSFSGGHDDPGPVCKMASGLSPRKKKPPEVVNLGHASTWMGKWRKDERIECISNRANEDSFIIQSSSCGLEHADALTFYAPDVHNYYFWQTPVYGSYGKVSLSPWAKPKNQPAILITEESVFSNGFIGTPRTLKTEKTWWSTFFGVAEEDLRSQFNALQSFDLRPSTPGFPRFPRNFGLTYLWLNKRNKAKPPLDLTLKRGPSSGFGLVVWAASNCGSVSRRLEYLKELNKHVRVDSIGKCWTTFEPKFTEDDRKAQWAWMGNTYKFWYGAENYICDNYISEKMFTPLAFGSVPIIYGNKNHHKYAPSSDSYIDVRDYPSAAALAAHLKYLDANDTAYAAYHAWRTRPLEELNPDFIDLSDRAGYLSFSKNSGFCALGREIMMRQKQLREGKVEPVSCLEPQGLDIAI